MKTQSKHFDEAIKLKKDYAEVYKARGDAKADLGDANAKQDFVEAYYRLGNKAYKLAQYQEALKNFNTSVELVTGSVVVLTVVVDKKYAYVYQACGNAKTALGKSKADLGDFEGAWNLYREAIKDLDKTIELDPVNTLPEYYGNRGMTKFYRGAIRDHNEAIEDYQAAIRDFTEAINRNSDHADAFYNQRGKVRCLLGYAKANQGHSKEARKQYNLALEDFKEAINLDSDNAAYYKGLGLANAALGKAKAAIEAFEEAKQLEAESGK